jgi:TIR domain
MTSRSTARRSRVRSARVFISHAATDRSRAKRIGRILKEAGIEYWFSAEHLAHGQDWYNAIGKALQRCNWLVIVATRTAVRSRWVRHEVTYALQDRRYENRVVPLLFEDCKLHKHFWSLRAIQYLDFRKGWHPGTEKLTERFRPRPKTARTVKRRTSAT